MAKKGPFYYTGEGVFLHKGKDYPFGAKLPEDVSDATIERLLKKKNASDKAPGHGRAHHAHDDSQTGAQLKEALALVEQRGDEMARLQQVIIDKQRELDTVTGERDAARDTVTELQKTVADLTAQLTGQATTPGADAAGAGPKK